MKIAIAGGTGFIGTKLTEFFVKKGHKVIILTRKQTAIEKEGIEYVEWLNNEAEPELKLEGVKVFINLAGVSINDGRWSKKHQQIIYDSRMTATSELLRIISKLKTKPTTFINASAIGIYPASTVKTYNEASEEVATDFLGKTVRNWEKLAETVTHFSIRPLFMRFGVVLEEKGAALSMMAMPYKLFIGGTVGSGKQWLSWVHIDDVVGAIDFAIENEVLEGPINVTAPRPMQMKQFGQTIGKVLSKPHWLPVPSFALKILLGEKSKLVLEGQRVIPEKLIQAGYQFKYPTLELALNQLLGK